MLTYQNTPLKPTSVQRYNLNFYTQFLQMYNFPEHSDKKHSFSKHHTILSPINMPHKHKLLYKFIKIHKENVRLFAIQAMDKKFPLCYDCEKGDKDSLCFLHAINTSKP